MRKPIEMQANFLATAVSILLTRAGKTELTFTKEEFDKVVETTMWLKLEGDFDSGADSVPTSVTFTLCGDEDVPHDLH